jgi:predicted ATPase
MQDKVMSNRTRIRGLTLKSAYRDIVDETRGDRGWSQEKLAEEADVSLRTVKALLRLERTDRRSVKRICEALDLKDWAENIETEAVRQEAMPTRPPWFVPAPLTALIGRDDEREQIYASLTTARLVTLTGTGGIGKTRLAIAVAEDVRETFADGVWFVELASLSEPLLTSGAVASVLGIKEEHQRPLTETLAHFLADKSLLLILDNCEHLLEGIVPLVSLLLKRCGQLKILATSRERLAIQGEHGYEVKPLSVPDTASCGDTATALTVERLLQYDAVRLFVERAGDCRSDFSLTAANAPSVIQICSRLDGVPLAIELAAAQMDDLPLTQIAAQLDHCIPLLTGGGKDVPRQQTLQACLDWSYSLLLEEEKTLLRRLSVFSGGWTLEAAEQVCSDCPSAFDSARRNNGVFSDSHWQMRDLLRALINKSLVVVKEDDAAVRYRLLETIRQYAQEQLPEEDAVVCRKQHLAFFLAMAEEAERVRSSDKRDEWIKWLQAERDNLRAAFEWGRMQRNSDAEGAARLCITMQWLWWDQGPVSEGRQWCNAILRLEEVSARTLLRAKVLNAAGVLACIAGDYDAAQTTHEESLAIKEELGDKPEIAKSLGNLGNLAFNRGDFEASAAYHLKNLTIAQEVGDREGIAIACNNLGNALGRVEDFTKAKEYHKQSLAINEELGDKRGVAKSLLNLGNIAYCQGDYEAAVAHFQESLTLNFKIGNCHSSTISLKALAEVAAVQNQPEQAARLWGAAERVRTEVGFSFPPSEMVEYDRLRQAVCETIGDAAFEDKWQQGHRMTLEEAVRCALGKVSPV